MTSPGGQRLPYLYIGEVTRRDDPDGLARIKVRIAGLIEPETPNWAYPIGMPGSGHAQSGEFTPPWIGANVAVFFKLGNPDYPYYICGPWGAPGGESDIPTNAVVEGADRQNAVIEDQEWTIERDSRSTSKKYLIKHKLSSQAVLIDADDDEIHLVRENSNQALVRGTEYRQNEVAYLGGLHTALLAFATSVAAATTLGHIISAGSTLQTALNSLPSQDIINDSSAYLSDQAYTE